MREQVLLERHNGDGYLLRHIVSRGQTDRLRRAFRTNMMQTEVLFLCCLMHSGDDIDFKHFGFWLLRLNRYLLVLFGVSFETGLSCLGRSVPVWQKCAAALSTSK